MMKNKFYVYIISIFVTIFSACSDDDTFTTSWSDILTMQTDTLSLDTCFSNVPTPHKMFFVYNKTSEGIRISNVKLSKGNQTGYRVNVNGTYLGDTNGYQTRDLELRAGDSLRIFVELTSRLNGDTLPVKVEDNIVFTLENGRSQSVCLNAYSWDATLLNDYVVGGDSVTTLCNEHGKPIVVYGKLLVDTLATLVVEPGSTLYFHDGAGIDVIGNIQLRGEQDKEITLRCDRLDWMVSNLTYDNNPGQWGGIRFAGCSYDNKISYTDIHAGTNAIVCDSAEDAEREKLTIKHSTIHNMKGYGIKAVNSKLIIENTQISNAFAACMFVRGGNVIMNHCTVAQYYPFDARRGAALYFTNGIDGYACPLSMNIKNSLIKGYATDVVTWSHGGTEDSLNVEFDHCLVRTTPGDDYEYMFKNCIIEDEVMAADTMLNARNSFVLFDTNNFYYDFTPLSGTAAVGAADVGSMLPDDRRGKRRDNERPDIGCFETNKETETAEP